MSYRCHFTFYTYPKRWKGDLFAGTASKLNTVVVETDVYHEPGLAESLLGTPLAIEAAGTNLVWHGGRLMDYESISTDTPLPTKEQAGAHPTHWLEWN